MIVKKYENFFFYKFKILNIFDQFKVIIYNNINVAHLCTTISQCATINFILIYLEIFVHIIKFEGFTDRIMYAAQYNLITNITHLMNFNIFAENWARQS